MLKAPVTITVLLAVGTAFSCSTTSVRTDHDHQAEFSSYSTFAWFSSSEEKRSPTEGTNQIVDHRIRHAIGGNIRSKGFTEADSDSADLLVTYYASLNQRLQMHTTGWGYGWGHGRYWGYGYGFWPGWGYTTVSTYHEGTIIVDIVDREKNQLVWRGVVSRVLGKKSSSEEKIDQAMGRLMSDFPPS